MSVTNKNTSERMYLLM